MATELRAGTGLHDSMRSISLSGYGPLSEEFSRALEEIRYGESTGKALIDMSERINSEGLQRAVYQITRTLDSGGDLAKTLSVIADDTAYELRMKLKDYAQKLNSFHHDLHVHSNTFSCNYYDHVNCCFNSHGCFFTTNPVINTLLIFLSSHSVIYGFHD